MKITRTTHSFSKCLICLWLLLSNFGPALAQGTSFTYQGRLTDSSLSANGSYDFQFKLFDAVSGGTQVGATASQTNVNVSSGVFTATLDFGAGAFPGAARFLEISVRLAGGGAFTTLSPRQPVTSTPYAIQSLNAAVANSLSATCNGCVTSTQIGSLPSGNGNYIQNGTTLQASSNFNISGNGTIGGTLTANALSGNGASLTNLNAANIATGTLAIARGGTGTAMAPTTAGQFLRSTGANAWAVSLLAASDVPGGSGNYIQNTGTQQANSNFSISGSGNAGSDLNAGRQVSVDSSGSFNGDFDAQGGLRFGGLAAATGEGIGSKRTAGGNAFGLDFFTGYIARLSITNGGNVGIGTTAPAAKLHVSGGSILLDNNQAFSIKDSSDTAKRVLYAGTDDVLRIGSGGGGGFTHIAFDLPATADVLWLTPNGNIGMGTVNPADKLQVLGDLRVGNNIFGCVKDFNGTVIAGICSSDLRFKKDVTPLAKLLPKFAQLQPVNFFWRSTEFPNKHFGTKESFGLIAQDVEAVFPELVTTDEQGYKAVNYSKLPLLTIQAVKELKAENDDLKTRLGALEQLVKQLKEQAEKHAQSPQQ